MSVVGRALIGAVSGAVGTVAMDAVWYARYRRDGGDKSPVAWEFGSVDGWDEASAPGQVGRKLMTALTGKEPPDRWATATQNAVHWATGSGWGAAYGVVGRIPGILVGGPVLGTTAWLAAYALLPAIDVYKPITAYDAKTLAKDLSAHLVFGTATAWAYGALSGEDGAW